MQLQHNHSLATWELWALVWPYAAHYEGYIDGTTCHDKFNYPAAIRFCWWRPHQRNHSESSQSRLRNVLGWTWKKNWQQLVLNYLGFGPTIPALTVNNTEVFESDFVAPIDIDWEAINDQLNKLYKYFSHLRKHQTKTTITRSKRRENRWGLKKLKTDLEIHKIS